MKCIICKIVWFIVNKVCPPEFTPEQIQAAAREEEQTNAKVDEAEKEAIKKKNEEEEKKNQDKDIDDLQSEGDY